MRRLVCVWTVLAWLGACARPLVPQGASQLAAADAALLRGCYDCMLEARAIYLRLASGGGDPSLQLRVLEVDLLIAVREKELSMAPSGVLVEARRIASALPSRLELNRGVAVVDAIPDSAAMTVREFQELETARARVADARAWLARSPLRAPVRDYLQSALDCAYETSDDGASRRAAAADSPLLLRYRDAICEADAAGPLTAVLANEPRFVEASLFIARTEIARLAFDGPRQAGRHVAEVLARFPGAAAVTYLAADYYQIIGDHAEALRFYDRTLALHPGHGPALLGRLVSLSHLERAQDAIEAATELVERGDDLLSAGYYWRAYNRHARGQLADARSDVDAAKQLMGSEDLLVLAGVIEYEQGDLDTARADLAIVTAADQRRCEAPWYLGLIDQQRKQWSTARRSLEQAMECYRERARTTADQRRQLQSRGDLEASYRARTSAALDTAIAADIRRQHSAALAAARSAVADQDLTRAQALVELAGDDPELADGVTRLRAYLEAHTRGRR